MDNGRDGDSQRLDKWLWFARLFKTRAEAAEVCTSRHLRLDGRVIDKPHAVVRMGSVISFPKAGKVVVVKVEGIADHRGPFNVARHLYADLSPQPWRAGAPAAPAPERVRALGCEPARDPIRDGVREPVRDGARDERMGVVAYPG